MNHPTRIGMPIISLEKVNKVFSGKGIQTHALNDVELQIHGGEYLNISGPSGCGKSTLLSIIGLLDTPSSGSYRLNNESMDNNSMARRAQIRNRKMGFIFQNFNLIGDLNVFRNVELPLVYQGVKPEERRERVEQVLRRVDVIDHLKHHPNQLSGGQQQRVAVARALVVRPEIIMADEPTGNLDSVQGASIMALLSQLHGEGATVCLVTHDPRYANQADRQVEILDGSIVNDSKTSRNIKDLALA